MSLLTILTDPNPLLHKRAELEVNPYTVEQLVADMQETVRSFGYKGFGSLAAPQIGVMQRLFVIMLPSADPLVVINPEIKRQFGGQSKMWELCFSIPGKVGRVKRYKKAEVVHTNRNGESIRAELDGLLARTFLHEFDHLEGILWTDLVENAAEIMDEKAYFEMRKK